MQRAHYARAQCHEQHELCPVALPDRDVCSVFVSVVPGLQKSDPVEKKGEGRLCCTQAMAGRRVKSDKGAAESVLVIEEVLEEDLVMQDEAYQGQCIRMLDSEKVSFGVHKGKTFRAVYDGTDYIGWLVPRAGQLKHPQARALAEYLEKTDRFEKAKQSIRSKVLSRKEAKNMKQEIEQEVRDMLEELRGQGELDSSDEELLLGRIASGSAGGRGSSTKGAASSSGGPDGGKGAGGLNARAKKRTARTQDGIVKMEVEKEADEAKDIVPPSYDLGTTDIEEYLLEVRSYLLAVRSLPNITAFLRILGNMDAVSQGYMLGSFHTVVDVNSFEGLLRSLEADMGVTDERRPDGGESFAASLSG